MTKRQEILNLIDSEIKKTFDSYRILDVSSEKMVYVSEGVENLVYELRISPKVKMTLHKMSREGITGKFLNIQNVDRSARIPLDVYDGSYRQIYIYNFHLDDNNSLAVKKFKKENDIIGTICHLWIEVPKKYHRDNIYVMAGYVKKTALDYTSKDTMDTFKDFVGGL